MSEAGTEIEKGREKERESWREGKERDFITRQRKGTEWEKDQEKKDKVERERGGGWGVLNKEEWQIGKLGGGINSNQEEGGMRRKVIEKKMEEGNRDGEEEKQWERNGRETD